MNRQSIGVLGTFLVVILATNPRTSQAGLMFSSSSATATVTLAYSGGNVHFNQSSGVGTNNGSLVDYTATGLTSSATFSYNGSDSGSFTNLQRIVETFVNNTGYSLVGLTISLSGDGSPTFAPLPGNASYPSYVNVATNGPPITSVTVTNSTGVTGTANYGAGNTSVTFKFSQLLANGASFSYYVPTESSSATGSLTMTETALPTPEPASIVSAFCGAIGLMGLRLKRAISVGKGLVAAV